MSTSAFSPFGDAAAGVRIVDSGAAAVVTMAFFLGAEEAPFAAFFFLPPARTIEMQLADTARPVFAPAAMMSRAFVSRGKDGMNAAFGETFAEGAAGAPAGGAAPGCDVTAGAAFGAAWSTPTERATRSPP